MNFHRVSYKLKHVHLPK